MTVDCRLLYHLSDCPTVRLSDCSIVPLFICWLVSPCPGLYNPGGSNGGGPSTQLQSHSREDDMTAVISQEFLKMLGIKGNNLGGFGGEWVGSGPELEVITPIDGSHIATVRQVTEAEYDGIVERAHQAFREWRQLPAPRRGDIVRQLGNRLREVKHELGALVTLEMGKIVAEGEGEVQEMIDICDFATGLSRQLYGLTMHSERAEHRMYEQ